MLLLGAGPRALLLQIAHPPVAAGVAEHSDFRATRGAASTARSAATCASSTARRWRHAPRSGASTPSTGAIVGAGYRARDPELSLWVHATLVDSTLVAYDAWLEPLARDRAARFYAETRAARAGVRHPRERCCRPTSTRSRRTSTRMLGPDGPVHPGADRPRAGRRDPPSAAARRARPAARPDRGSTTGRCGRRIGLLPAERPGRVRASVGTSRAAVAAGSSPAGARGGRSCRPGSGRCRRRSPRTGGWRRPTWRAVRRAGLSRSTGSAAANSDFAEVLRGRVVERVAAASRCAPARSGGPRRTPASPPRTPSSPSRAGRVDQVAALDVDLLVVARGRVVVDRSGPGDRSSSGSSASSR